MIVLIVSDALSIPIDYTRCYTLFYSSFYQEY